MSVRLHITQVYQIEYGNTISSQLTDDIINIIKNSENGWVSEDEYELEIDKKELKDIRNSRMPLKLQMAINQILQESDPNNDFIHLSLF